MSPTDCLQPDTLEALALGRLSGGPLLGKDVAVGPLGVHPVANHQVIDPAGPGAGASGGVVGALAPHAPDKWNAN